MRIFKFLKTLPSSESFPGVLLLFFTALALIFANSPLSHIYAAFAGANFTVGFDDFGLSKPLVLWINDGLIAIFFLCIGLELKQEILTGQLRNIRSVSLPIFGALGGMIAPALIFAGINHADTYALSGWAIPTATDIAFAVGILMLLGRRIPSSLKLFLLSLAIFDDLGAIIIIALFYTSELSALALALAALCLAALYLLNRLHFTHLSFYVLIGVILWAAMLKSGVHATLSGVLISIFIPLKKKTGEAYLAGLHADLHPWVIYFILPLFAFVNAGVDLRVIGAGALFSPVSLGIFLGLFLGKQLGVFAFCRLFIALKLAQMPPNVSYVKFYGVCILTGIGFTMSLFVDGLAYGGSDIYAHADRLAILLASLFSALVGYVYLRLAK